MPVICNGDIEEAKLVYGAKAANTHMVEQCLCLPYYRCIELVRIELGFLLLVNDFVFGILQSNVYIVVAPSYYL